MMYRKATSREIGFSSRGGVWGKTPPFILFSLLWLPMHLECFVLEMHPLARDGVAEAETFGVEVEAVGGGSVENVAFDGSPETFWMGAVDAELVSASTFGVEFDASG